MSMSSRLEDCPYVSGKRRWPGLQVGGVIGTGLQLGGYTEIGAQEATAELGDQFLPRGFATIFCVAREVPAEAAFLRSPMHMLVADDGIIAGRLFKCLE